VKNHDNKNTLTPVTIPDYSEQSHIERKQYLTKRKQKQYNRTTAMTLMQKEFGKTEPDQNFYVYHG